MTCCWRRSRRPWPGLARYPENGEALSDHLLDFIQPAEKVLSVEVADAHGKFLRLWQRAHRLSIPAALKGHLGIGQGNGLNAVNDMSRLRFLTSEELPTGREIEKQVAHLDLGAGRRSDLADILGFSSGNPHLHAHVGRVFPGHEAEMRYAGDAGQGLAPESHRAHGHEVDSLADLARGVAFQTEKGILAIHAAAVVPHGHLTRAAPLKLDPDAPGSGVETVFHQLFYEGGWALDDLSSRDLAGYFIGEYANFSHRNYFAAV